MFSAYINGVGTISPQETYKNDSFLENISEIDGGFLWCQEPKYKEYINPRLIRRMGRIVRMGVASARIALDDAGVDKVDAIITGTAMGCLRDTERFLTVLIENDEKMLTPAAFIQSTHNTVGGQIALVNKQNCYNFTYVHRGFSFESGLLDALLLLEEGEANNVLLGGVDELTKNNETIFQRLDCIKSESVTNLQLAEQLRIKNADKTEGAQFGEGSSFFVLSGERGENSYAQVKGLSMLYKPSGLDGVRNEVSRFLEQMQLNTNDIDLVLVGNNGDRRFDWYYEGIQEAFFKDKACAHFKHLCGEYSTSSGFAMWAAANILKRQTLPEILRANRVEVDEFRNILIYDQHQGANHALILLSKC